MTLTELLGTDNPEEQIIRVKDMLAMLAHPPVAMISIFGPNGTVTVAAVSREPVSMDVVRQIAKTTLDAVMAVGEDNASLQPTRSEMGEPVVGVQH